MACAFSYIFYRLINSLLGQFNSLAQLDDERLYIRVFSLTDQREEFTATNQHWRPWITLKIAGKREEITATKMTKEFRLQSLNYSQKSLIELSPFWTLETSLIEDCWLHTKRDQQHKLSCLLFKQFFYPLSISRNSIVLPTASLLLKFAPSQRSNQRWRIRMPAHSMILLNFSSETFCESAAMRVMKLGTWFMMPSWRREIVPYSTLSSLSCEDTTISSKIAALQLLFHINSCI